MVTFLHLLFAVSRVFALGFSGRAHGTPPAESFGPLLYVDSDPLPVSAIERKYLFYFTLLVSAEVKREMKRGHGDLLRAL